MLSFALKCFLLYVVNQVKPPPSFGFWSNTLHLSLAIRPHRDLLILLHPWCGEDCIPWCYLGCLCIHCDTYKVSCLARTNPHFFITFFCCWRVNIVLLVDNIYTLAFVIIVNPTWINLVTWVVFLCGVVTIMATQGKEGLYRSHYPSNVFLPFAIKVFRCLHQQSNNFFHRCANMAWTTKGIKT
jgi:hypothetical protein